jgi:hypothetical protein
MGEKLATAALFPQTMPFFSICGQPGKNSTTFWAKSHAYGDSLYGIVFSGQLLSIINRSFNQINMIRSIIILAIGLATVSLTGANYMSADARTTKEKRHCKGYSVIAVDKGIDCNGDTIKLIKTNGFFQRVNQ